MAANTSWKLEIAWSSDPDTASPAWIDVTNEVDGEVTHIHGRPSEGADIQPGRLEFKLKNNDHTNMPGNQFSSRYPNVRLAKQVRFTRTIGGYTYLRLLGNITSIDPGELQAPGVEQQVAFVATDRLDRLDHSRPQVSTLAEHILYNAPSGTLKGYFPLLEQAGATQVQDLSTNSLPVLTTKIESFLFGTGVGPPPIGSLLSFGGGTALPADDGIAPLLGTSIVNGTASVATGYLQVTLPTTIAMTNSQVLTLVVWVRMDSTLCDDATNTIVSLGGPDVAFSLNRDVVGGGPLGEFYANASGAPAAKVVAGAPGRGQWQILAGRFRLSTSANAQEIWVGSTKVQGTPTGSPPASTTFDTLRIAKYFRGSIAHVQIYVSSGSNDYTYAQHLAQIDMAGNAMQLQTTGQRIASLAAYAGVTDTDIDTGTSVMTAASLASKTRYAAMAEAATTENGDLFMSGSTLKFRARTRRYNPTVVATIQKTWLSRNVRPRGDVQPITDARVSGTGGTATSIDSANQTAFGDQGGTATIQSATSTEASDRAGWLTYNYAVPRTRLPGLPFSLIWQSDAIKQTLLGLEIGDRVAVAGLPATAPEGIGALHIEGWTERCGTLVDEIEFVCSPVLGALPGTPDPWFMPDDAVLGVCDNNIPLAY